MNKSKEPFSIGTRVRHMVDKTCNEGVVVWKHSEHGEEIPRLRGKIWNVHWSNGNRGIYATEDIQRIPPKNLKKIVEAQLDTEDIVSDEEK